MTDRRLGALALLGGSALALVVQVAAPVGVPLYDGVVVQEPYRYLRPGGGQAGAPTSFASTPVVSEGVSPLFAAATTESPPQAQLISQEDAFALSTGATGLRVSITPVDPPPVPPDGRIAGNVYRFSVTDQAGNPLPIKPCEGCITLVLRAPEGTEAGQLRRFADGAWSAVETNHAGMVAMYSTSPTALGDYAVVVIGGSPAGDPGLADAIILGVAAVVVLVLLAAAVLAFRSRSGPSPARVARGAGGAGPAGPRPRSIPSKRKRPPRPPTGSKPQ